jgi:hypothetical protein
MAVKSTDETGFCPACDDHSVGAYCDSCDESTDCGVCGCNYCGDSVAGSQSDNRAAAQALSKTLPGLHESAQGLMGLSAVKAPHDRAGDTSRRPGI